MNGEYVHMHTGELLAGKEVGQAQRAGVPAGYLGAPFPQERKDPLYLEGKRHV